MNTPDSKKIVSFLKDMLPEFMDHKQYDTLKAWHRDAVIAIESMSKRAEAMEVEFQRQREAYAQMLSGLGARNDVLLAMMKDMASALEDWQTCDLDESQADVLLHKYKGMTK